MIKIKYDLVDFVKYRENDNCLYFHLTLRFQKDLKTADVIRHKFNATQTVVFEGHEIPDNYSMFNYTDEEFIDAAARKFMRILFKIYQIDHRTL